MQKRNIQKDCATPNQLYQHEHKTGLVSTCTQTHFNTYSNLYLNIPKKTHIVKELCTQTSKTFVPVTTSVGSSPDIPSPVNHMSKNSIAADRFCNGDYREQNCNEHIKHQNPICCEGGEGDIEIEHDPLVSPKALASIPFDRSFNVVNFFSQNQRLSRDHNKLLSGTVLTQTYLEKNRNKLRRAGQEDGSSGIDSVVAEKSFQHTLKSQSYIEKPFHFSDVKKQSDTKFGTDGKFEEDKTPVKYFYMKVNEVTQTDKKAKSFSFMSPTIASERKNQSIEIKSIERLISPSRRARSISPRRHKSNSSRELPCVNVPYIDRPDANLRHKMNKKQQPPYNRNEKSSYHDLDSKGEYSTSSTSDSALFQALCKLRDPDWNTSLRGLAEIVEICKVLDPDSIHPHMTVINQRLIELIRSPRSHVSRSSCQAVGHLLEYVKDTRRPEFNELVDTLLCKCADSNKFIRHDANLALDCMVTHIPTFHAVRALCAKGPEHKNPLVRTAVARLLVCATVLAGPQNILHPQSNEYTRRRIILTMVGFLEDRHSDVRKYGERMYKMLSKDRIFDLYLSRYLERDVIHKMRKIIKFGKI